MNAFVLHALSRIDEPLYSMLRRTSDVWQFMRKPERPVRMGGLNPGRTFYLIGGFNHDVGLASWFDRALGYIVRAERKGWIPVIDCPVNKFGQSWDMYFKQPAGVSPEEARDSQNVVIANDALEMIYKRLSARNIAVRNAAIEKYIRLQPRMQTFIDNALPGFIGGGGGGNWRISSRNGLPRQRIVPPGGPFNRAGCRILRTTARK